MGCVIIGTRTSLKRNENFLSSQSEGRANYFTTLQRQPQIFRKYIFLFIHEHKVISFMNYIIHQLCKKSEVAVCKI